MAKKNKGNQAPPAVEPEKKNPTVEPEVVNNTNQKPIQVLDLNNFIENVGKVSQEGLDPNRRVDLLKMMHETYRMDPAAAKRYGMSQDTVDEINRITAIGQVAALACEVAFGKNPFAIKMSTSQLIALNEVGKSIGVVIDTKALPAPDADGKVTVQKEDIKVSKETEEQLKKEEEIKKSNPEIDPTKIETEEDLIKAINFILVDRKNVYSIISDTINFYRAYLSFKASKSENKDEELKKIESKSNIELFKEIRTLIGKCPLVINGIGRSMVTFTSTTKSPISAFCMLRNSTKNKKTGVQAISDQEVADLVRILVEWAVEIQIAEQNDKIAKAEEDIKTLSKDKKANAKGIEDCESKIETYKNNIKHFQEVIDVVVNPSSESADNLIKELGEKEERARRMFNYIVDSYYNDIDTDTVDAGAFKHNIQQRAGIILNLFRDATSPILEYSESNLIDLEKEAEDSKKDQREIINVLGYYLA